MTERSRRIFTGVMALAIALLLLAAGVLWAVVTWAFSLPSNVDQIADDTWEIVAWALAAFACIATALWTGREALLIVTRSLDLGPWSLAVGAAVVSQLSWLALTFLLSGG